ncbi:TOX high mobility group box family member 4 [Condylostylus longicornis]|uniref:TOX high mobility group box family member 4 n=1 Tax=Condylostylus longicornis TaxID=2530218 RepID=UPI00244E4AD1|nr:TOX high mobility group box family member 4 [Condylostylus longicornis]
MMSSFHSSFNDDDFENSATNYALSQNYDHDIDYNDSTAVQGTNTSSPQEENEDENSAGETKKKKAKDPNEPVKPVSAYAAFFRDTQIAIKSQNPNASFEEISKIVASMWEALDVEHKNVYKKNAEIAKKEYLRALSEYRANNSRINDTTTEETGTNSFATVNPNKKQLPIASKPAVFTISTNDDNSLSQMNSPSGVNRAESPEANTINEDTSVQKCIRDGCTNKAVVNPDWEDEYCCNECAVRHCRNVFNNWVKTNKDPPVEELVS